MNDTNRETDMSEKTNVEVVQQAYAAFGCGDVATLLRLIAGNVDWHFPECANIPWTGGFRSHEEVKRFLASLAPAASLEAFEPRVFGAQRDRVIVTLPRRQARPVLARAAQARVSPDRRLLRAPRGAAGDMQERGGR